MAVTTTMYRLYKTKLLDNSTKIALATDTIKVALCTSTYVPSTSHSFFSDITNEVTGTGYSAGGMVVAGITLTGGTNTTVTATDSTFASSSITARYAIVYKSTGVASTSPLICYVDFGTDFTSVGNNLTIDWDNTNGIFYAV